MLLEHHEPASPAAPRHGEMGVDRRAIKAHCFSVSAGNNPSRAGYTAVTVSAVPPSSLSPAAEVEIFRG